jgi:hypothetical protein
MPDTGQSAYLRRIDRNTLKVFHGRRLYGRLCRPACRTASYITLRKR